VIFRRGHFRTTADRLESADADPIEFVAVTRTAMREPMSAAESR
jgi:hypothetical protein